MAVTDNFNRADGGLGANWTTSGDDGPAIASNAAIGTQSEYTAAFYSGVSFNATHTSQIVKGNASNYQGPGVRIDTGTGFGIWVIYFNHGDLQLCSDGSGGDSIGSPAAFTNGQTAKLAVNGTTYTMSINGTPDAGGTVTDATLSDGAPGIGFYGTSGTADNWEGTGESGATGNRRRRVLLSAA